MADILPKHAKRYGPDGAEQAFMHYEKFHGIKPTLASDRLHEIKHGMGYPANRSVVFDRTGNIYDPDTLEWIGSLTAGGAE